jgi:tetratricopeptide (TPR) repeat protein
MSKQNKKHTPHIKQKSEAQKVVSPIKYGWALVIAVIAFLLYSNTIGHEYALDDSGAITGNRYVQEGFGGIFKLLKVEFWHFANVHLGYYRPLALITFAIEHQFFHGNPHISHFVNCLIFAFSGFMLFIVLNKIFNAYNALFPFFIALLFVAHPIHTEIVANIKGRDELLSFFNVMLMLWFALKFTDTKKIFYLILSLLFCYLGMLSKETALTGVMLLPVFLFYYKDYKVIECLKKSIPFALVVILFFIQKKYLLGTLSGIIPSDVINYPYTQSNIKLPTTFMLFAFCLRLLIVPHPLRYDYSFNQIPAVHMSNIWALLGIALFIAGAIFAFKQTLKKTTWGFAFSLFYITLIPALAFTILRGGIFAERFLFFPSLGFCIALVYGAGLLIKTDVLSANDSTMVWLRSNAKFVLILTVPFILYSIKTVSRNEAWKDNFTLFSKDVKTGKNSAQNQNHFGNQYIYLASIEKDSLKKQEYVATAIAALRQSLVTHPKFGESYYLLGLAYQIIIPNSDSAIYYYNKAIETAPGHADSYYHLGIVYQNLGKNNVASYFYNEAIKYNPQYLEPKKAAADLKAAGIDVFINPLTSMVDTTTANKDTRYYFELGNYHASQGDYNQAAKHFIKSIELDPNNEQPYINLANCYGMLKQYDKALAISNQLLAKNPKNTFALKNMAVVYNILGDAKKSEEYLQKIREIEGK